MGEILGATIGTLGSRNDVGRSAALIVDTHPRTGEVPLGFVQMLSEFRIPCYYFGCIADNKKLDEYAFLQHHLLTTMTGKLLRRGLTLPSFTLDEGGDEKAEEDVSPPKLTILQWSSKDGLICPDSLKKRWQTHEKFSEGSGVRLNHTEFQTTRQLKREGSEIHSTVR